MARTQKSNLRLMVVDDESDNLDLLYRTFRREFEVFKADSALNALEILEQQGEMAIIISDQRMPKMNGTEFLSRTVEPFPDTMRILLTGYSDLEDLVGAINAGKVFKYITKPWNPEELKAVVQQAAEIYERVKHRTRELHRALRRESTFNAVTTAIRESLDYHSMLQTIVKTIGHTFAADTVLLYPVERSETVAQQYQLTAKRFCYPEELLTEAANGKKALAEAIDLAALLPTLSDPLNSRVKLCFSAEPNPSAHLIVPLTYQQDTLALLILSQQNQDSPWSTADIELIEGVAEQAALAISQAKLYQRIQKQTEQMQAELAVARQIQSNLLCQNLPQLDSIRIQAHCYPAREVGGDFFEVFVHPQGDIWLAVGDVSGKGVPAALFMASAISLLRRELAQEFPPSPNIILQNLNTSLFDNLVGSNCFITMVLARYSPATHELAYANAGHIYPMLWSHTMTTTHANIAVKDAMKDIAVKDRVSEPNYLKVRGVPLGILPLWKANADQLKLNSGEVLLLTSDGITEATLSAPGTIESSGANSMLKQSGLWQLLSQQQGTLNLNDLLAHIQAHSHVQEDDQTILSLEVL